MADPDYVARNRSTWNRNAPQYASWARRGWERTEPQWGIWHIPESEVGLLRNVADRDVLEAGCGTAYVSAWAARLGARPVGIDNSPAQLATARRMQGQFDMDFPLVHGIAEKLPFADESFDLVISEYGAAIWSDPYLWIPEAARVLRANGELAFLGNSLLLTLCMPDDDEDLPVAAELLRDYFGLHRIDWPNETDGVEFHLGFGDWIRLFRANGLEILDFVELQAPEAAETRYDFVDAEWAHRWPSEQVWRVKKRA